MSYEQPRKEELEHHSPDGSMISKALASLYENKNIEYLNFQTLCDAVIQFYLNHLQSSKQGGASRAEEASPYQFDENELNHTVGLGKEVGYYAQTMHHLIPYEQIPPGKDKWEPGNLVLGPDRNKRIYEPGSIYDQEAFLVKKHSKTTLKATRTDITSSPQASHSEESPSAEEEEDVTSSSTNITAESPGYHFRTSLMQDLYRACILFLNLPKDATPSPAQSKLINECLSALHRFPTEYPSFPISIIETVHKNLIEEKPNVRNIYILIDELIRSARMPEQAHLPAKEETELSTSSTVPSSAAKATTSPLLPPGEEETDSYLTENRLQRKGTSGDGNCFFTALGIDREDMADLLTQDQWEAMVGHNLILAYFDRPDIVGFLRTNGHWNSIYGEIMPMIAAYIFNLDLHIFDRYFGTEYVFNPRGSTNRQTILYNGINHYDGTEAAASLSPAPSTPPASTTPSSPPPPVLPLSSPPPASPGK